jgi:hypothetical protein
MAARLVPGRNQIRFKLNAELSAFRMGKVTSQDSPTTPKDPLKWGSFFNQEVEADHPAKRYLATP